MMTYKSYIAHVTYDDDIELFHGEVINTRDVITFQGKTVKELKQAFHTSVNDYLEFCAERGEEADRPFSGKFNLRLDPDLHRDVYVAARKNGKSLNEWVTEAIRHHLSE